MQVIIEQERYQELVNKENILDEKGCAIISLHRTIGSTDVYELRAYNNVEVVNKLMIQLEISRKKSNDLSNELFSMKNERGLITRVLDRIFPD